MDNTSIEKIANLLCNKFGVKNELESVCYGNDHSCHGSDEYWLGESLGKFIYEYVNPDFFKRSSETQRSLRIYAKLNMKSHELFSKGVAQSVLLKTIMRCSGLAADEKGSDFLDERKLSIKKNFDGCNVVDVMCKSAEIVFNASKILHENAKDYSFQTLVRLPFEEAVDYLKDNYGIIIL